MPNCKRCNSPTVWNKQHHEETGKWVPFDPKTGEPHDCPEYNAQGGGRGTAVTTTFQQQQKQQQPNNVQVTDAMSTLVTVLQEIRNEHQKTTDAIHQLAGHYERIVSQLVRLGDFYDGLLEQQKGTAAILSQYLDNKNGRLAEAEAQYDQDKEDGLV